MSKRVSRRSYDAEFKRNTADLYINGDKSLSKLSEELSIPESTLYNWVNERSKLGKEAFSEQELSSQEREIVDLKKQLSDVKLERDILKKALAIFSRKK